MTGNLSFEGDDKKLKFDVIEVEGFKEGVTWRDQVDRWKKMALAAALRKEWRESFWQLKEQNLTVVKVVYNVGLS